MGRKFFKPAHRDAAEPAIIAALRAVGASVWPISGEDVPDLLVGYKGQTYLLEVKTPGLEYTDKRNDKTYKRDGKLSKGQQAFMDAWKGGPCKVVLTPEEALYAIHAPVEGVLQPLDVPLCECTHSRSDHSAGTGRCARLSAEHCECERFTPPPPAQRPPGNVTPTHVPKKRGKK